MFTPEIAKKASNLLSSDIENSLRLLFDDLITQKTAKIKGNSPDLELRIAAVEIELLTRLKNYKNLLEDAVKRHAQSN